MRKNSRPSEDGFTLLEMLVVMTIVMMVFAGISNSMATRNTAPSVTDMAKDVQAMMYRARAYAISSGQPQRVWVNPERKTVSYGDAQSILFPESIGLKITTGREMIAASGEIELLFLADGSSSGMDIEFEDENVDETASLARQAVKLRVNWLTGLPSVLVTVPQ